LSLAEYSFEAAVVYALVATKYKDPTAIFRLFQGMTVAPSVVKTIKERFHQQPGLPVGIKKGTYSEKAFDRWVRAEGLEPLHEVFYEPEFDLLLRDNDIRLKLEIMAMTDFDKSEMYGAAHAYNKSCIDAFVDFFCNFSSATDEQLEEHIDTFYYGNIYHSRTRRCAIGYGSKEYVRQLLGVGMKYATVQDQVQSVLTHYGQVFKIEKLGGDESRTRESAGMVMKAAQVLRDLGHASNSAADLEHLLAQHEEDFNEPKIYTVEELEAAAKQG